MTSTASTEGSPAPAAPSRPGSEGKLAALGVLGATLASSCCILPLALVTLGVGGAWMPKLTALAPYQPYFLTLAGASLGLGFWKAYRGKPTACRADGYCARPASARITKAALWTGALLALGAVAVNALAPYFV